MTYFVIKVLVSGVIVAVVSEVARRHSLLAALLASLPLTSLIALIWRFHEGGDTEAIAALSRDILWLVVPSLVFFLALPKFLEFNLGFYPSLALACLATSGAYAVVIWFKQVLAA
ncbi:MAG: DUF3147 family protein [Porticoccaceae bacterium]|jgi:uncharacterized membrane protein (GlpM family)|nr:DUF3147 family protein [Porticoccaceae bacterium]MEA3300335.1 DUF3147 family protein [Pseudomonadota bacterium]HLS97535.1 DUF3147 family protein [Porticoccaceae bacterium]